MRLDGHGFNVHADGWQTLKEFPFSFDTGLPFFTLFSNFIFVLIAILFLPGRSVKLLRCSMYKGLIPVRVYCVALCACWGYMYLVCTVVAVLGM